jgi:aspartyl-tRNA(Asn)/glutamyl-tRNA(Gln) amidotransferase subunit A
VTVASTRLDGLTALTLTEVAGQIASGALSPIEITDAYLARIDQVEPQVNAYVTVCHERARADARRAVEERARGLDRGPLHGVPLGIKDLFDTAGVRTTAGSGLRRDTVPARDSAVAARLRAAGSVLLGKHGMHELAWGGTSDNPHFGAVRNPHDPARIPGGSSGGSAASVVAGTAVASVGTDTCGSVRIPAALSGCVGLKPTYGRVSMAGAVPLSVSLDHAGPITRTVADAALLLGVLAGPDPDDPRTLHEPVPDLLGPLDGEVRGLRIGRLRGWFEQVLDPETGAALDRVAEVLRELGCQVIDLVAPDPGPVVDLVFRLVAAEAEPVHRDQFATRPEGFGEDLRLHLSRPAPTSAELAEARAVLAVTTDWLDAALREVDLLTSATVPAPAPQIGEMSLRLADQELHVEWVLTRLTSIFDVAGLPALSVPCGRSARGLPLGLQVIGRRLDEVTVLRLGHAYETAGA